MMSDSLVARENVRECVSAMTLAMDGVGTAYGFRNDIRLRSYAWQRGLE